MDEALVINATTRWIKEVVVAMNLCPFAAPVVEQEKIYYTVSDATDDKSLYLDLISALDRFQLMDRDEAATGFLILSKGLSDFADFNDFFDLVEQILDESGLHGVIQIVGFHPDYRFADCDETDPANYTNRSPYPMFHLILEDDLEAAVAAHPDPAGIPRRNIRLLRELGLVEMQRRLAACQ
ncbi:DUF1415 domain-containing protein [Candidatus Vondammii sp. HM_W22]|uniref:DUF1415 domain-containing protein n=1 Tax=Candidatus Vondammii sp. HM_W22 TaxID=2687299 RepID=UPI001F1329B2|nr:DUF1415 domain-containing protein [Candidatus Vondammii sp. HM_W22]